MRFYFSHQVEEKSVQNCEQQLADLRRRSTSIAPLKLRRSNPNRPITVESLCDWETDKVRLVFWSNTPRLWLRPSVLSVLGGVVLHIHSCLV